LCISKAVATELRTWMEANAPERLPSYSIRHFTLGAEINGVNASRGWPPDGERILATLQLRPTFLMVGTIEPRKGYAQVLGAFEELWGRGVDVNLAIVGRPGWLVDSLLKQLRRHPESGKRLLWLQQISDEFLDAIYPAAVCLIAASESEGYGLPLVEAARHRLPIIARDIAPFREIADGSAFFFHSTTASGLASEIEEWLAAWKTNRHIKPDGIEVATWEQSARELLACVLPVNAPYLVGNGPKEDGMISVDEVLAGIRRELNAPRGTV
jgi:glycosyltransferase involved in cell wall biosynthesis